MTAASLARRTLPFVVTVAILAYLTATIDLGAAFATLNADVARVLLPAMLLWGVVSLALEGMSIERLSESAGRATDVVTCARIKAASYAVGLVNYALGAAALTVLLRRRVGLGLAAAAGLVATVSLADLSMLIAVTVVSIAFSTGDGPALQLGAIGAVGGAIAIGLVFLRAHRPMGRLEPIRELDLFRTARTAPLSTLALLALLRTGFVFTFIGAGYASMIAFDVVIPAGELIVGMSMVALVGALPIAVAGLGTVQLATVELFGAHADEATLVACSLSMQAAMIAVRMATALLFAREFTHEAAGAARGPDG